MHEARPQPMPVKWAPVALLHVAPLGAGVAGH
jgi:hypothetical protein